MKKLWIIAYHVTPKFSGGGVAFTMNGTDYKRPMVIVETEQEDDETLQSSDTERAGRE